MTSGLRLRVVVDSAGRVSVCALALLRVKSLASCMRLCGSWCAQCGKPCGLAVQRVAAAAQPTQRRESCPIGELRSIVA